MENHLVDKDGGSQIVWDFSKTTSDQLLKLAALIEEENTFEAERYTKELISEGFLSYRNEKEK
jgi:hypothetical protein